MLRLTARHFTFYFRTTKEDTMQASLLLYSHHTYNELIRKIKATNELFHMILGTIDTPEKFEKQRKTMAENVWREMKANDSHECRNCHNFRSMDFSKQKQWSAPVHKAAMTEGQTCIDCHKGIAHQLPK